MSKRINKPKQSLISEYQEFIESGSTREISYLLQRLYYLHREGEPMSETMKRLNPPIRSAKLPSAIDVYSSDFDSKSEKAALGV